MFGPSLSSVRFKPWRKFASTLHLQCNIQTGKLKEISAFLIEKCVHGTVSTSICSAASPDHEGEVTYVEVYLH